MQACKMLLLDSDHKLNKGNKLITLLLNNYCMYILVGFYNIGYQNENNTIVVDLAFPACRAIIICAWGELGAAASDKDSQV